MDDKIIKEVIAEIGDINALMPEGYLRRNHLQYEFVSYVSLVTTLYLATNYNGAGRFIVRAYKAMTEIGTEKFDTKFLSRAMSFLDFIGNDMLNNNRMTGDLVRKDLITTTQSISD